jgi:hypothetical protein
MLAYFYYAEITPADGDKPYETWGIFRSHISALHPDFMSDLDGYISNNQALSDDDVFIVKSLTLIGQS